MLRAHLEFSEVLSFRGLGCVLLIGVGGWSLSRMDRGCGRMRGTCRLQLRSPGPHDHAYYIACSCTVGAVPQL